MNDEFKIKISRRTAKLTSNVFCFCMIASLVFFGTILNAQQNPAGVNSGSLNVLDFGAKGDGVADDTDAIQKCFAKAAETYNPPEVFFPTGTYLVSRTLLIPPNGSNKGWGFINIRGNAATIKQSDPAKDIFYLHRAFRNLIEGITFDGGKTQIRWWTENQNGGHIVVRDCFFKNSSSYAIDDVLRKDTKPSAKWYETFVPYLIGKDTQGLPFLTPNDAEKTAPRFGWNSSVARISRCSFVNCMNVLSGWSDWLLMDDCKIETHPDMEGAAILSGGQLLLENVTGLAHVTPGKNQCWIDKVVDGQEDGIDLKNVKFKSDSDKGLCVVRNWYKFSGGRHVQLIADNCEFQSAGSKENCLFYLIEAPNLIIVRNCRETSGRDVNILGFEKKLDEDYFHAGSPEIFSFMINDNNRNLIANLPENMEPFADNPLPKNISQKFEQYPAPSITLPEMRRSVAKELNVMNFGASGNGKADDSEAFRKAFAKVAESDSMTEVIIPNGIYRLDKAVELPPRVIVRGAGKATLTAPDGRKGAIFTAQSAERILMQNLVFENCDDAVAITTKTDKKCNILFDHCTFDRNNGFGITCLSGTGAVAEPNKTALRISDCTFRFSRALLSNAGYALMDNAWIENDPDTVDCGVIVNKGTLHLRSMLGVPHTTRVDKTSGKSAEDTKKNDLRWIDNYYKVFCDRCRFGGENGGLPMVVNFTADGEVLFLNSWCAIHEGNPKRITIVDCEAIPKLLAFQGNISWPAPQRMITIRSGAKGLLEGSFYETGNTAPPSVKDERNTGVGK